MGRGPALAGMAMLLLVAGCVESGGPGDDFDCDQSCQDGVIAFGIQQAIMAIFHRSAAVIGEMHDEQDCSHGGTANIDGSITELDGMDVLQAELTYDLQDCRETQTDQYELTLHGLLDQSGPFGNGGGALTLQFDSALLVFEGAAWSNDTGQRVEEADSCVIATLLECDDDGYCETTGAICERAVDMVESSLIN
jgi:hypothetical protein